MNKKMDLAKALDTANHNNWIDSMKCLGIRGISFDLLKSHLEN